MTALAQPRQFKHVHKRVPFPRIHRPHAAPIDIVSAPEKFPVRPPLALAGAFPKRVCCGGCEMEYCETAVVTDKPERFKGELVVRKRLYCWHCQHVMFWFQPTTPSGEVYDKPTDDGFGFIRKRSYIESFLRAHPQAVGVC